MIDTYRVWQLIVICAFFLYGYWLWRYKYNEHFHNPNWTPAEYFQHIRDKHPDIVDAYDIDAEEERVKERMEKK